MTRHLSLRQWLGLELFRRYRHRAAREHALRSLFWECTLRCNVACRHCGSDCRSQSATPDMPLADFLRVVDSVTPHVDPHHTMMILTGGEPLMRPDLEACGRALYEREYPWGIVTNGLALTPARFRALLQAGLRAITVSFDGQRDSHNWLRGHPRSYDRAREAIAMIAAGGHDLAWDVVTCANQRNFAELPALKEDLIALGVRQWRIFTIFPTGRAAGEAQLKLSPEQFADLLEFIRQTRREGRIALSYGCEGFMGHYEGQVRDNLFFCRAGINVGSVLADGSIGACPSIRGNFIQGNIYRDDFMEVWNRGYERFRDRSWARQGACAGCKQFRYCEGNGMHLRGEQAGELLFCHYHTLQQGEKVRG